MKIKLIVFALGLLVVSGLTLSYLKLDRALTERPERSAHAGTPQVQLSQIDLPVQIDLAALERKANETVPTLLHSIKTNATKRGRILGQRVSGSARVTGSVTRGHISVTGSGDRLVVTVPVSFRAKARPRGDVGRALGLRETAKGSAVVTISAVPVINPDWSIGLRMQSDYRWSRTPALMLFGSFKITLRNVVDPVVRRALADLERTATATLANVDLRSEVETYWRRLHAPLQVSASPETWIVSEPEAVEFSGLTVAGATAHVRLGARGRMALIVGPQPQAGEVRPLPNLTTPDPKVSGVRLNLPISVGYDAVEEALADVVGLGESRDLPWPVGGSAKVAVNGVEVYPAGSRVVLALEIEADSPNGLLDTRGTVYLLGDLDIDMSQRQVRVKNLGFARATNNWLVDTAMLIASLEPIRGRIEKRLTVGFADQYDDVLAMVSAGLNGEVAPGVFLQGSVGGLGLSDVIVEDEALSVVLDLAASVVMRVDSVG